MSAVIDAKKITFLSRNRTLTLIVNIIGKKEDITSTDDATKLTMMTQLQLETLRFVVQRNGIIKTWNQTLMTYRF